MNKKRTVLFIRAHKIASIPPFQVHNKREMGLKLHAKDETKTGGIERAAAEAGY